MMGNSFILADMTNEEYISFLGYGKERELIGNKITAQLVAYYLFENNGHEIVFVGDQWNVGMIWANHETIITTYKNVTEEILKEMIEEDYFTEEQLDTFCPRWRSPLSTADHAQLTENLVDSQSDSATNSKEGRR